MSGGAVLDIFNLRDSVVKEYERFATSFTTIHAQDIDEQVKRIHDEKRYWPEPLIQINPNYRRVTTIKALVEQQVLDPICAEMFQFNGVPLELYEHQKQAIGLAGDGASYVVTTGTGSGKSLCFFIPIVHRILTEKRKDHTARTRAIIIYPMNALANSQLEEIKKFINNIQGDSPISIRRYTGQEDPEERRDTAENPPDILLTNFMMLEMLMTRQEEIDRRVIDNCTGLNFLVLDELHTYRGRQGADVALLVRRVRERLKPTQLQCIGTSATMASEGSVQDKNRIVAQVASKLFSVRIDESCVISETLERITDSKLRKDSILDRLGQAIDVGIRPDISDSELRENPLAVWVETVLGIHFSDLDQRWLRAKPKAMTDAVIELAADSGRDENTCRNALRELLLISSIPEREREGRTEGNARSFFAFKLHQFISGAGNAFATLEPAGERTVTVDGQQFLPAAPEKRLYPIYFCRECGHEYYTVRLVEEQGKRAFLPRSIDDAPPSGDTDDDDDRAATKEEFGFVTLHPDDDSFTFNDDDEDYPETWLETSRSGQQQLRSNYRSRRARQVYVAPTGEIGEGARAWYMSGRFQFCLRCTNLTSSSARDRTRLASLSAEGRSSATTVLVSSVLRWMHGPTSALEPHTRKLLGFTDNRQDAALQAGHFNDFLFVSLIRAAFLRSLQDAGEEGLRSDALGEAQQRSIGFSERTIEARTEWLQNPNIKGINLQDAEQTLRRVLSYRVWHDQRRGWRYTNPNLEQLGLVKVEYAGIDDLVHDQEEFDGAPDILRNASPQVRRELYQRLFDHLRRGLAVKSKILNSSDLERTVEAAHSRIRPPWGFAYDDKPQSARWLMVDAPSQKEMKRSDASLLVRAGNKSALGKALRAIEVWGANSGIRSLKGPELDELTTWLLKAAANHGIVSEEPTPFDALGWQLSDSVVIFKLGEPSKTGTSTKENAYFLDLYENLATMLKRPEHPLFGFEAREHTAQVEQSLREIREWRFRYGAAERELLEKDEVRTKLSESADSARFLPVLFCSPTMELGVDISALNVVYMRNMPPTPANYAQRSGRAGRSGQAALVLTYASSQGPHDQYYFNDPPAMVHGEVKAPLLDLANRELVDSHLQAVWLSCVPEPLEASIAKLLTLDQNGRPINSTLQDAMHHHGVASRALERTQNVLKLIENELTPDVAPWYTNSRDYAQSIVDTAYERFNRAFDRWRTLLGAAEEQRVAAQKAAANYSVTSNERREAESRAAQAGKQVELLLAGRESLSSDFYTYRYLATEGFLPGYNFPRLPLMAYIPSTVDGRGRHTFLQRPRFLALAEFGPRSLVYHEGRSYRVVKAMLPVDASSSLGPQPQLPTESMRICAACGGGHPDDLESVCHACDAPLSDAEIVNQIYRIENVVTQATERITANDEERQREGFELQTTFRWATRDQAIDVRKVSIVDGTGEIARLAYGAGATITRINKGLRRRQTKATLGFRINPVTGYWASDKPAKSSNGKAQPTQLIVPSVRDNKNALLFIPLGGTLDETSITTLQYAILRGLEATFELEEGEIIVEPVPTRDNRKGFLLYEATEGGAGVLSQLVVDPKRLREVARAALSAMHFDLPAGQALPEHTDALVERDNTQCVAACYRCLLSYFNQPDHELIDRRSEAVRDVLLRLARVSPPARAGADNSATQTDDTVGDTTPSASTTVPSKTTSVRAQQDDGWFSEAARYAIPAPDSTPLTVQGHTVPLVWRQHYVAAVESALPPEVMQSFDDFGFDVVVFDDPSDRAAAFERLAKALGRSQ